MMLVSRSQDVYLKKTIIRNKQKSWPNLGCTFVHKIKVADLIKRGVRSFVAVSS